MGGAAFGLSFVRLVADRPTPGCNAHYQPTTAPAPVWCVKSIDWRDGSIDGQGGAAGPQKVKEGKTTKTTSDDASLSSSPPSSIMHPSIISSSLATYRHTIHNPSDPLPFTNPPSTQDKNPIRNPPKWRGRRACRPCSSTWTAFWPTWPRATALPSSRYVRRPMGWILARVYVMRGAGAWGLINAGRPTGRLAGSFVWWTSRSGRPTVVVVEVGRWDCDSIRPGTSELIIHPIPRSPNNTRRRPTSGCASRRRTSPARRPRATPTTIG